MFKKNSQRKYHIWPINKVTILLQRPMHIKCVLSSKKSNFMILFCGSCKSKKSKPFITEMNKINKTHCACAKRDYLLLDFQLLNHFIVVMVLTKSCLKFDFLV